MGQPLSSSLSGKSGLNRPPQNPSGGGSSRGWFLFLVLSILLSLVTGLVLVWLSIERADSAFRIGQLQTEVERRIALKAKLEVERDKLLAPYELRRKAEALQMHEAKAGQIRKLTLPKSTSKETR